MAETRQECMLRWQDSLRCLDEEIERLEKEREASGGAEAIAELDVRISGLKSQRQEVAGLVEEARGADDVLWARLRKIVDAMFDRLTPTLGGKDSSRFDKGSR